jgi:hypothetical protein
MAVAYMQYFSSFLAYCLREVWVSLGQLHPTHFRRLRGDNETNNQTPDKTITKYSISKNKTRATTVKQQQPQ